MFSIKKKPLLVGLLFAGVLIFPDFVFAQGQPYGYMKPTKPFEGLSPPPPPVTNPPPPPAPNQPPPQTPPPSEKKSTAHLPWGGTPYGPPIRVEEKSETPSYTDRGLTAQQPRMKTSRVPTSSTTIVTTTEEVKPSSVISRDLGSIPAPAAVTTSTTQNKVTTVRSSQVRVGPRVKFTPQVKVKEIKIKRFGRASSR